MKHKARKKGFSLVELMIVVAIVAILVALAIPSYSRYIRKANRGEAQQLLLNWANNQEIWRASHTTYSDGTADANGNTLPAPTHDKYTFSVSGVSATAFMLTADPKSGTDQVKDTEQSVNCDPLTLDQSNAKTPPQCW